ncbi:MAG TPA: penicillin-insensitive murein endopeptidase, partial [Myxococcota bacterium]|nr:penicillin-insensitive murein endopeptidase [Myxococcota bacterium]
GGFLAPHKSHQSGLDADIGFYFKNQPKQGPRVNLSAMTSALDHELTWTLITALAGPNEEASNVEYMFIGYGVQEKLYKWAQKQGVPQKKLDWLFQYPRGSRSMNGLIRHEPGHDNHIHIRFKCPRGDACL